VNTRRGHKAPPEAAAKQARRQFTPTDRRPVQLSLFGEPTEPADLMHPSRAWAAAEWHLRFTVNTMPRGRSHWWIADLRRRSA
jgi:hypothetical protein